MCSRISILLQASEDRKKAQNLTQPPNQNSDTTDLKMGSITEVWKNSLEWQKYYDFLDNFTPEGTDSAGEPMKLSRYAKFLQLYVQLHYKELEIRKSGQNVDILKTMIFVLKNDPEGFFDTERCLKCIDKGIRTKIMKNLSDLKKGLVEPGVWIYEPAYSPVLDKLNYMLGFYHAATNKNI